MKLTSFVPALTGLLLLSACSDFSLMPESKKVDYKSAAKTRAPSLEIPPDLTSPGKDDRYAVPDMPGGKKGTATYSEYNAERTSPQAKVQNTELLPQVDKAHIERAGSQRWLEVSGSPDQVWDLVKDFWQENGFVIAQETPEAGVMETDWAENRAKLPMDFIRNTLGKLLDSLYSTPERDKFRTRLEPGEKAGTTDIFISHRGMYEVYISEGRDQTRWEPRPADPDLEAEMLRRLMVRFGTEEKHATAMVQAAKTQQPDRATLTKTADGSSSLMVQERFDRAWRRVGLALDRVGFTVMDRDRTKGLFYVRYVDPEADAQSQKGDDKGFLSKLAFWKSDKKTDPDSKIQYQVFVKETDSGCAVQVLSKEGGVDRSDTGKKILGLLYDQLK